MQLPPAYRKHNNRSVYNRILIEYVCRTTTETEFETDVVTSTVFIPGSFEKRNGVPRATTTSATPFASEVATIPASVLSSACSCIQDRISLSTSTTTVEQQLTVAGTNNTATSTVQEIITTQTQRTLTEASVFTTITRATTTATLIEQTCAESGQACTFDRPDLCCSGACADGSYYACAGLPFCCL